MSSTSTAFETMFTAQPTQGLAKMRHQMFQDKTIYSLRNLLVICQTSFKTPKEITDLLIDSIDNKRWLSPTFYSLHWKLGESIRKKSSPSTLNNLKKLVESVSDFYCEKFAGSETLQEDILNDAVMAYVNSEDAKRGDGIIPAIFPIGQKTLDYHAKFVNDALAEIKNIDEVFNEEIEQYLAVFRLFDGRVIRGLTSVRVFGAVYLRIPEFTDPREILSYYVEHLTHEISHLHLHTFMADNPLVLNPDSERYKAPLRIDPRPMRGIFHAVFVLSRIVMILGKWLATEENEVTRKHLSQFSHRFRMGCNTIKENARLTASGNHMFQSIVEVATPWLSE